ncbi:hypothetical protein COO08_19490 [Bacillus toyonensis]|uniref:hypothetical protein n=1 Tax=Bacillus toyonensis TaxID=155322 RepID=UPI000BEDC3DF|nr:hypothetical protein [Bacillus toyonensis]PEB16992.1 hypothetical protein COO08_19490 [Bacillus toyonensis]
MNTTEVQEKIWSVRENWDMLKPYLNDKDVVNELNEMMSLLCEMHPIRYPKMWETGDAPWEYTTTSYWCERIDEALENDEQYQKELNELFQKLYGSHSNDDDENDLWDELLGTQEYQALDEKYYKKHSPKENTIEYYQAYGACHWINRFLAELIEKALNVETFVWQSDTHTVVEFRKDDTAFYSYILIKWESVEQLYDFMYPEDDC